MSIRAGVAGVGRLGREHARILAELTGVRLVGVHDRATRRGESVAGELGVAHCSRLEELLPDIDVLVVAVPTRHHHSVARVALLAGVHALVEKPLASSLEEADDLIRIAGERGLELAVGHVERFNGAVRSALPYLDRPRFIESQRLAPFQPRGTDVTVVLDLMIHDIDLVLGLVRSPVDSLHAVGTPVLTDSVDIANVRLIFGDGTVAEITASRVSEHRVRKLRLFQPTGYLSLDLARGGGEFLRRRDASAREHEGAERGNGSTAAASRPTRLSDTVERIPLRADGEEPLRLELEAFLRSVRGEESRAVRADEGRAALKLAFRISREIERFSDVTLEAT